MQLTATQKTAIITAARAYADLNKLSQNDLAARADINAGYLSTMLGGKTSTKAGQKDVEISDKWFIKLAEAVGYALVTTYWKPVLTVQFQEIMHTLVQSKEEGRMAMLIGDSGCGKTSTIDLFMNKHPLHSYRLTVSSLYKLGDVVQELCERVGVEVTTIRGSRMQSYSLKVRLDKIAEKLVDIKQAGGKPLIILDEGENFEMSTLKMIKALYDKLDGYCPIVIVGTHQLLDKLLNLSKRNRYGIPQLYRRFKAGQKIISPINNDYKVMLEAFVEDAGLRALITTLCDNYGEVHDYLEPALRKAAEKGVPLTEEFFRVMYNLKKK